MFITAPLYDYMGDPLLAGLRAVYGADCVDWPRKPMMYGDFPSVYGRGFTVWSEPIADLPAAARKLKDDFDLVIYGCYRRQMPIDWRALVPNRDKAPRVAYVDGYDDTFVYPDPRPYFKRELKAPEPGVFPSGLCIPDRMVRPLNVEGKTQLHQTHVQDTEFTSETGYKFTEEKEYYDDLARSFFGITMRKGGWDCMRHYEILAAGTVVMFKNLDEKPDSCAPRCPHFINYTTKQDFMEKANRLVVDGKPTEEYRRILQKQREWLLSYGTATAHAREFMSQVEEYFKDKPATTMPKVSFRWFRRCRIRLFWFKEEMLVRGITFVKQNKAVDWFYYRVFRKIPGMGAFISYRVLGEKPYEGPGNG
ncbi:MAG TPA: hypothetical protein VG347_14435 [Verrucomicrobiae bacterium]|nr:hypothetical protein [Verrucomicrobiae bacterium]